MFHTLKFAVAGAIALGLASMAHADGHATTSWSLDGENSNVAFGSIKKDNIGEVHSFGGLSGGVMADGTVDVAIDLASVETNIDIRNERMIEHVFKGVATANLKATIDMSEVNGLGVGETTVLDVEGVLSLVGTNVEIETEMFVVRMSETSVMVTTNDMIFLSAEDAGINAGVSKLMELAKLPGITRTSPITLRLIFNADEQKAEVAPAAPAPSQVAALSGDTKKGKKVFRKCKACHALKEGKNAAGPSLYKIFGAQAAQTDGFGYSDALKGADIVWNADTLAAFVANPKEYLPGNKMSFRGLKKEADIENLIAYLAEETGS